MDTYNKSYEVLSVCKADLEGKYTKKQIAKITDSDMAWIARKMAGDGMMEEFWIALEYFTDRILEEKD